MKKLILALLTVLCLSACTQNDVDFIKENTMTGYETTTIGKAFDASFDEPQWEAFTGEKGERVVQFTGKISQKSHDKIRAEFATQGITAEELENANPYIWKAGTPVIVQWIINVDGTSFQLSYWESKAWKSVIGADLRIHTILQDIY